MIIIQHREPNSSRIRNTVKLTHSTQTIKSNVIDSNSNFTQRNTPSHSPKVSVELAFAVRIASINGIIGIVDNIINVINKISTIRITRENFYPRSPCGERQLNRPPPLTSRAISIHALLAESDWSLSILVI